MSRFLSRLIWVGSSLKDMREFHEPVQDHMGYALYVAQLGGKHSGTRALRRLQEAEQIAKEGKL